MIGLVADHRDLFADEALDVAQVFALGGVAERDGDAVATGATGATDAMDIDLGLVREVVVDEDSKVKYALV